MVTREESVKVSAIIPNSRLQMIEGFGHTLNEVDFEVLAKVLIDHLNE